MNVESWLLVGCCSFFFFSLLSVCVCLCLYGKTGIEGGERARRRQQTSYEAYAAIGRNLNIDTIIPRKRLHKSRSFFERAIKNRQKKKTTISFVN